MDFWESDLGGGGAFFAKKISEKVTPEYAKVLVVTWAKLNSATGTICICELKLFFSVSPTKWPLPGRQIGISAYDSPIYWGIIEKLDNLPAFHIGEGTNPFGIYVVVAWRYFRSAKP